MNHDLEIRMAAEAGRWGDVNRLQKRYSEDQPRDEKGRFGSGSNAGEKSMGDKEHKASIGQTQSGKDIPGAAHGVYNDRQKMPGYNGPTSPALASGHTAGSMLRQRMPEYSKQDHLDAYEHHTAAAKEMDKQWGKEADKASQETFGRPFGTFDYKISGIGREEFSSAAKDKLRDLAHTSTDHKEAATAHWYAAGKRNSPGEY